MQRRSSLLICLSFFTIQDRSAVLYKDYVYYPTLCFTYKWIFEKNNTAQIVHVQSICNLYKANPQYSNGAHGANAKWVPHGRPGSQWVPSGLHVSCPSWSGPYVSPFIPIWSPSVFQILCLLYLYSLRQHLDLQQCGIYTSLKHFIIHFVITFSNLLHQLQVEVHLCLPMNAWWYISVCCVAFPYTVIAMPREHLDTVQQKQSAFTMASCTVSIEMISSRKQKCLHPQAPSSSP